MENAAIGKNYDDIAEWWLKQMENSSYGLSSLKEAIKFLQNGKTALDVGCGCEGRFIKFLSELGYKCSGVDISAKMIEIIQSRFPDNSFYVGDIAKWILPDKFDLITAWDSTFHLEPGDHKSVLAKLCNGLNTGGVLLFTAGGGDSPSVAHGEFGGRKFSYSTPGIPAIIESIHENSCSLLDLRYDQHPENHVTIITKKR